MPGKTPWGCHNLTRYLVEVIEVKNIFFSSLIFLPQARKNELKLVRENRKHNMLMLRLLIYIELGYTQGKCLCLSERGCMEKPPALCLEMGGSRVTVPGWLRSRECKRHWAGTRVCRILQWPRHHELLHIGVLRITSLSGLAWKAVSMGKEGLRNPWSLILFCPWAGN